MCGRTKLGLFLAPLIVTCCITRGTDGVQNGESARAAREVGAWIDELGTTLKAAAMSGAITEAQAWEIWTSVVQAAKTEYRRVSGPGGGGPDAAPSAKGNVIRLIAPRRGLIRVILEPEFLRRDLQLLVEKLDLDRTQASIAVALFDDYEQAYKLAAAPLKEGLAQYRSAAMNVFIASALEEAGVKLDAAVDGARRVGREQAVARMTETLTRIEQEKAAGLAAAGEEDREQFDAWKRRMIAATTDLGDRLSAIRNRTTSRLEAMGRAEATVTADALLDMARQLRSDRAQLRADLVASLEFIMTETQRGIENVRFEAAMARIRIERALPRGRLGGESMNLFAAMAETGRDRESRRIRSDSLERADAMLAERAPGIATRLDDRTEAAIARELVGLEMQSVRDRIAAANGESIVEVDKRRLAVVTRPYAEALHREVSASVAVRDALLALLEETSAYLEETDPNTGVAAACREAALRRGFPVETRRRWGERAIAAALALDELEVDVAEALLAVESDIATELETLRSSAIAKRIRRDPKLARDLIDVEFEGRDKDGIDEAVWREVDAAAFEALDQRVEGLLREMLRPDQLEQLPGRSDGEGKGRGKGRGRGGGKPGGK